MCGGSNIRKRENESAQRVAGGSRNFKNNVQLYHDTHPSFHSLFEVVAKIVKKLHRNCRFGEFQPGVAPFNEQLQNNLRQCKSK